MRSRSRSIRRARMARFWASRPSSRPRIRSSELERRRDILAERAARKGASWAIKAVATAVLAAGPRTARKPSRPRSTSRFWSEPNAPWGPATELAAIRSTSLRASLAKAWASTSSVSAAKPTRSWSGRRRRASAARMSSVGSNSTVRASPVFLSFCGWLTCGRQSLTAAVIIKISQGPNKASVCRSISAAETTG